MYNLPQSTIVNRVIPKKTFVNTTYNLYFALGRYDLFAPQLQRMDGKQYEHR